MRMKVLFLGDSITDTGRNTNNGSLISIGQGYAMLVSAKLMREYPGKYEFLNYGISGNRIVDIYARIKTDCWNHKPDVISILVGVNDVAHEFSNGNGVDNRRFYRVYRMLIEDTLEQLPGVKLILMEPFVMDGANPSENRPKVLEEVRLRRETVKRLAEEFGLAFVPLQDMLNEMSEQTGPGYWVPDNVHPSPAGHQLIADAWLEAFEKI